MSATAIDAADTTGTCPYEKLTPAELRAELARIDEVCVKQELQIKDFTEGTLSMISDFSGVILAHIEGNSARVRAGLDVIVSKYVTRTGDLH